MKRIGAALLIALVLIATGCTQYQYIPVPPGIFDNWEDDNEVVELVITETVAVEVNGTVPATVEAIATYEDGTTEEVDAEVISYVNTATVGVHSAYAAYENKMVDVDVYVYAEKNVVDSSDNLSTALTSANEGDIIVLSGEITAPTATISITAANVKIIGDGTAKITTAANTSIFTISGEGSIIEGVNFETTATTGTTDMVQILGNNAHINNCTFTGTFDLENNKDVTPRGFALGNNATDILIENCSFINMRQPAYINNGTSGTIRNCYADNTKGWVVEAATDFTFEGNTFGENAVDICFIPGSPDATTNNYTEDECVAISQANNDCYVQNQILKIDVNGGNVEHYE